MAQALLIAADIADGSREALRRAVGASVLRCGITVAVGHVPGDLLNRQADLVTDLADEAGRGVTVTAVTRADVQPEHQLGVSVSRKRSARG